MASGYDRPDSLSRQLGITFDDLQRPSSFLKWIGLLKESTSVHDNTYSLRLRFAMAEPSLQFYYQHLQPHLGDQSPDEAARAIVASVRDSLAGRPFVELCREWIWAATFLKKIDLRPQRVGAYWDAQRPAPEFAIAAADPEQKKLLVGRAFWQNDRLIPAALEEIVRDSRQIPQVRAEGWSVAQVLFGRLPFAENIRQAAAKGVHLVTLAEIEPLLLAARAQLRWEWDNPDRGEMEF